MLLVTLLVAAALADEPTVEELLNASDDVLRGEQSIGVIEMHVKTKRYERSMKMKTWAKGTDQTLIRILEPAKDAGVATLKSGDNIWNYLPKVDRTMKVPAGMMSGSWMGSHFSNDDLVKESRLADDYEATVSARPADGAENWEVTLVPRPDAPVVWGKVVTHIRPDMLPVDTLFYDEDGELVRTMKFQDVGELGGRTVPRVMRLEPADKPGEFTEVRYHQMDFDVELAADTFTLQALKP